VIIRSYEHTSFSVFVLDSSFLRSCLNVVSRRKESVAILNLLFFGCVFLVAVIAQFVFPPALFSGWSPAVPEALLGSGLIFMVAGIFFFNLAFSAFVFVTLPGFAFFPLSVGFLLFRAVLWGLLLYAVPTWLFLALLPTVVLEGEAYVFAGVAGAVVGVSWIKPNMIYREEGLSKVVFFRKALEECLRLYFFVAFFLFVAAVVEIVTLMMI
jgi:hypothetical protein